MRLRDEADRWPQGEVNLAKYIRIYVLLIIVSLKRDGEISSTQGEGMFCRCHCFHNIRIERHARNIYSMKIPMLHLKYTSP